MREADGTILGPLGWSATHAPAAPATSTAAPAGTVHRMSRDITRGVRLAAELGKVSA